MAALKNIVFLMADDQPYFFPRWVHTAYAAAGHPISNAEYQTLFDPNDVPDMAEWHACHPLLYPWVTAQSEAGIMCLRGGVSVICKPTMTTLDCGMDLPVQTANPPGLEKDENQAPIEGTTSYMLNAVGYHCGRFGKAWTGKDRDAIRGIEWHVNTGGDVDPAVITPWLNSFSQDEPFFLQCTPKVPHYQTWDSWRDQRLQKHIDVANMVSANPGGYWERDASGAAYLDDYFIKIKDAIEASGRDLSQTLWCCMIADNSSPTARHGKSVEYAGDESAMSFWSPAFAGTANEGKVIAKPCHNIDIAATVLGWAGVEKYPNQEGRDLVAMSDNDLSDWSIKAVSTRNGGTGTDINKRVYIDPKWTVYYKVEGAANINYVFQRGWQDLTDFGMVNNVRDTSQDWAAESPAIIERMLTFEGRTFTGGGSSPVGGVTDWTLPGSRWWLASTAKVLPRPVNAGVAPVLTVSDWYSIGDHGASININSTKPATATILFSSGARSVMASLQTGENAVVIDTLASGTLYQSNSVTATDQYGQPSNVVALNDLQTTGEVAKDIFHTFDAINSNVPQHSVGVPAGAAPGDYCALVVVTSRAGVCNLPNGLTERLTYAVDGATQLTVFDGPLQGSGWNLSHPDGDCRWFTATLVAPWAASIAEIGTAVYYDSNPISHAGGNATGGRPVALAATRNNMWRLPAEDYYSQWAAPPGPVVDVCAHNTDLGNGGTGSRGLGCAFIEADVDGATGSVSWPVLTNNNSCTAMFEFLSPP